MPLHELRKASGAGGTVNAAIPSAAFKVLQGKPKRFTSVADSGRTLHRYFCGDCGSPLYSQRESTPEYMLVRAGTLDDSSGMKITVNIWTKSARSSFFRPSRSSLCPADRGGKSGHVRDYIDPATQQHPGQPDSPAPTN